MALLPQGASANAGCGCLGGLRALAGSGASAGSAVPRPSPDDEFQRRVNEVVQSEIQNLEAELSRELNGVMSRLMVNRESPSSRRPGSPAGSDKAVARHTRPECKRRWTIAADGAHNLSAMLACAEREQDEESTTTVDAPLPKAVHFSSDGEDMLEVPADGSVKDEEGPRGPPTTPCTPHWSPSSIPMNDEDASPSSPSLKKGTQSGWHADALDFGDMWLAAAAAARRGSASVDSIVDLVQSERERWAIEKQELEERLQELKDHQQTLVAQQRENPEKEKLKQKLSELRQAIKAKNRFGAWVCERHMQESDDEEENEPPKNTLREELRKKVAELERELRQARREARAVRGSLSSNDSPRAPARGGSRD